MKAMFGFFVFLLFLAGIALVVLQGRQLAQKNLPGGGLGLVGVSWRPVYVGAAPMPDDSGMSVQFEIDGSIKGHGGCNSFFGSLEQSESGIAVGPLGATRMACEERLMARESAFMEALQNTTKFEVAGDRLQMLDEDSTLLIELVGTISDQ